MIKMKLSRKLVKTLQKKSYTTKTNDMIKLSINGWVKLIPANIVYQNNQKVLNVDQNWIFNKITPDDVSCVLEHEVLVNFKNSSGPLSAHILNGNEYPPTVSLNYKTPDDKRKNIKRSADLDEPFYNFKILGAVTWISVPFVIYFLTSF